MAISTFATKEIGVNVVFGTLSSARIPEPKPVVPEEIREVSIGSLFFGG